MMWPTRILVLNCQNGLQIKHPVAFRNIRFKEMCKYKQIQPQRLSDCRQKPANSFSTHQQNSGWLHHVTAVCAPVLMRASKPTIPQAFHLLLSQSVPQRLQPIAGPIERALARALRARNRPQSNFPDPDVITDNYPVASAHDFPVVDNSDITDNEVTSVRSNRKKMHVNTLAQKYAATLWMVEETSRAGPRHIVLKCVKQFPHFFSENSKANLQKASRWWTARVYILKLRKQDKRMGNMSSNASDGILRAQFKCLRRRGRKRVELIAALYEDLMEEFERLRSAGLKSSAYVLRDHARCMINEASPSSVYNKYVIYRGTPLAHYITIRRVQHFMRAKRIVLRAQTGKLMVSPEKQLQIEKAVAFHLGQLKKGFDSKELNEDTIENADETHFVFNMDNGKTLGFVGDKHVKYADVVSGGNPITMMVRLSGDKNATIHPPMIIFMNDSRSYPIRGIDDNVPGVCYRSSPKGWMDGKVWYEWCGMSYVYIGTWPSCIGLLVILFLAALLAGLPSQPPSSIRSDGISAGRSRPTTSTFRTHPSFTIKPFTVSYHHLHHTLVA